MGDVIVATTKRKYSNIRVPASVYERLKRLAHEILEAKETAAGYDDVPLTEQGNRGTWVPLYGVITRALDEFENHRKRSNPKRQGKRLGKGAGRANGRK